MLLEELSFAHKSDWGQGDWTAVEALMAEINKEREHPIKMCHCDSWHKPDKKLHRFQGIFYYEWPLVNGSPIIDECPLLLLNHCEWYKAEPRTITNEKGIRLYIHWTLHLVNL
jgi:hypothetical protein